MTKDELDVMWNKSLRQAIEEGEQYTRYHFAALVAEKEREKVLREIADAKSNETNR
jgi:hypothetical protein